MAIDTMTTTLRPPRALTGRPLLDTHQDMALYLHREHLERRLVTALRRGLNVLLEGERGSGKTTLLHALRYGACEPPAAAPSVGDPTGRPGPAGPARFVYLGAAAAPSAAAVLARLLAELRGADEPSWPTDVDAATALARLQDFCVSANEPVDPGVPRDPADRLDGAAPARPTPGLGHGTCVLIDDVDPVIGHQLFGVLRDDLWRLPMQWVVTVESRLAPRLLAPPADAFFDVRLTLPPLTRVEALDLISRRLGRDLSGLDVATLPTTPRRLVRLAANTPPEDWGAGEAALAAQLDAAKTIGRSAADVVQALADLGPSSPSDERLLDRLGCTRARASQVLRSLHEHGLVTYRDVPADRPGRPNRVYELRPAHAVPA